MASGETLWVFLPQDNEPPATAFATPVKRNSHYLLAFDDTTAESAVFKAVLPRNYAGGGITVYVHYAAVATSGKVQWDISFERIGSSQQDIDADGFASVGTINVAAVPATSGNVDIVSVGFTDGAAIDSIAVGEGFRLKVTRDSADTTNDTAVGDVQLFAVELKET